MNNIKIDKILSEISNGNYQMKMEDDFDDYSDFTEYRTQLLLMIDDLKVIKKPLTNGLGIYLTQHGLDIVEKGGWLKYREIEKTKSKINSEKDKYDFLSKKWIYKTRLLPYVLSFLALIFAALTFVMNYNKQVDTEKMQNEIKQLKNEIRTQNSNIQISKKVIQPKG